MANINQLRYPGKGEKEKKKHFEKSNEIKYPEETQNPISTTEYNITDDDMVFEHHAKECSQISSHRYKKTEVMTSREIIQQKEI